MRFLWVSDSDRISTSLHSWKHFDWHQVFLYILLFTMHWPLTVMYLFQILKFSRFCKTAAIVLTG